LKRVLWLRCWASCCSIVFDYRERVVDIRVRSKAGSLHWFSLPVRYGVAVVAVALALLLKLALDPLFLEHQSPFLLLAGAVMVAAWFGGLGPGLSATALGSLAADYFFLVPIHAFTPPGRAFLPLLLFGAQGVLISALAHALRSARQRAEESTLEAQKHQEELRQSEERFRALVQNSSDIITVIASDGTIRYVSPAVERVTGYHPEELVGKNVYDYVSPHNLEEAHNIFAQLWARPGIHPPFEFDVPHKDGSWRRSEFLVNNLLDDPSVAGVVINQRDITERNRAEIRFRTLVEQIPAVTYIQEPLESDNPKAITYMSPQYETMHGYPPETKMVDEGHWLRRVHPEDRERVRAEELQTDETGEPFKVEYRLFAKDGRLVWVRDQAVLVRDEKGRPEYWLGVQYDITERKRAEEDLQRSVNSLLALYEAGQILASSLEREEIALKLLQVTQRMSALEAAILDLYDEGGELDEWHSVGEKGVLAAVRDHPRARAAAREAAEGGQPRSVELPLPGESGREASWGAAGVFVPLRVQQDRVIGVLEAYGPRLLREKESIETLASLASQGASALENARLYEELSERERELQDLVRRILVAQEDERRRVAYDIHDWLAQIAMAAYRRLELFVKHRPPDAAQDREELEDAVALVRQTVGDARRIIANLRPTTLDDFGLATAVRMSVDDLRAGGFEVSYEETLGEKRLPATLETALFRVAQEALANVRKHAQTERVHISLGRRDDEAVHLEVRDWGRGFEEPAGAGQQRGGGPGERVGLSSMQERVTLLGGRFEVRSEPGKGTAVLAEIPMQQGTLPENEVEGGH
jgi:PAS domain S-box-containing protein